MHACNLSTEWWLQEGEKLATEVKASWKAQNPAPKTDRQKSKEKEEVQGFTSTSFYAQISERFCSL